MLKFYINKEKNLEEITFESKEQPVWISLINPDDSELNQVAKFTGVPKEALSVALDEDESSYLEMEETYMIAIVSIPIYNETETGNEYITIPLAIIITDNYIITVCSKPMFIEQLVKYAFYLSPAKKTRFFFHILNLNALTYIRYLKTIIRKSNDIEKILRTATNNRDFFQLIELQKSLTYFTTALQNNSSVLEKISRLKVLYNDNFINEENVIKEQSEQYIQMQKFFLSRTRFLKIYHEDKELLEDVIIENKQAVDMVHTYSNILAGMLDALAGIVGNNLARTFKFLTLLAIIISVPNLISSMWGMNVGVPWEGEPVGFAVVAGIQISVTVLVSWLLWYFGAFKK